MVSLERAKVIRHHACERKVPLSRGVARRVALEQVHLSAYRCPFGPDRHWHVGHRMSFEAMKELAEAIRVLAQQEPR